MGEKGGRGRRLTVAVIGDGRIENPGEGRAAFETGKALVGAGYRVQTGGLGGVMAEACRGARSSPSYREGDTVAIVPSFDRGDANEYADVVIPTGLDVMRNALVVNADAVVAIGGGAGTLSEIAIAWSLFKLVIAYSNFGGWAARLAGTRIDGRERYPEETVPDDRVYAAETAEDVLALLDRYMGVYTRVHAGIRERR